MSEKLCKDCRHFHVAAHTCSSPNRYETVERYDLVLGKRTASEPRNVPLSCMGLRALKDECGPDGKWFEPRESVNASSCVIVGKDGPLAKWGMKLWR